MYLVLYWIALQWQREALKGCQQAEREGGSLLVRRWDLLFQTPRLQCMSTTAPDTSLTFTNATITDSNTSTCRNCTSPLLKKLIVQNSFFSLLQHLQTETFFITVLWMEMFSFHLCHFYEDVAKGLVSQFFLVLTNSGFQRQTVREFSIKQDLPPSKIWCSYLCIFLNHVWNHPCRFSEPSEQ